MIALHVNGKRVELDRPTPLLAYLEQLGVNPRAVAVEHNGTIIERAEYENTTLKDGDTLEIVRMVGGGHQSRVQPGDFSPDRLWRWDGTGWVPAVWGPAQPQAGLSAFRQPSAAAAGRRSWAATAGGLIAILGAVMIIIACAVPYVHYTDASEPTPSPSVFNEGYGPSIWFAAEPVGVALIAIVAGVVLVVWMSHIPRALAAGVLLAGGAQISLLFVGYFLFAATSTSAQVEPGGVIGMFAGLLLFAGGLAPAITLFTYRSAPAL
jgi:thiamine biosynthesis protein ThiS